MIRRGLQLVAGVGIFMMLGAAPSLASMPHSVALSGFPDTIDGVYFFQGELEPGANGARYYAYRNANEDYAVVVFRWSIKGGFTHEYFVTTSTEADYFADNPNGALFSTVQVASTESNLNWSGEDGPLVGALGIVYMEPPPPDPYPDNFPDWESAAVKIPLGFGFGMAFWAAALALTIPMRWVRELTSAAT